MDKEGGSTCLKNCPCAPSLLQRSPPPTPKALVRKGQEDRGGVCLGLGVRMLLGYKSVINGANFQLL